MKNKRLPSKVLIVPLFLLIFTVGLSYGQVITGKIAGTVKDDQGTLLPGVTVEASSPTAMGTKIAVTSDKGGFRFSNLPPGTYKLVIHLDGFQRVERENIKVAINTTVTLDITMQLATVAEEVTVIAVSPIIDVKKTGLSSNFTSEDLEKVPAGRHSFADIVKQAPGMLAQGESGALRWSFGGSGVEGNAFYFDGVEQSSPELGIPWTNPNQDIFEEVEVSGIGTAAEYGLITGAVINIVTKSGGNELSGSLSHYGQYDFTTGDNNPTPDVDESFKRWYRYDLSLSLGGPIIKDKLWFFSNFNIRRAKESNWQGEPDYVAKDVQDEGFFKLTSNINNKHKLVVSFAYENEDFGEVPDPWNLPETVIKEVLQTYIWNARYTWLASSNSYFDIKYSGWWSPDYYDVPAEGCDVDLNKRPHFDDATGVLSEAPWWSGKWDITTHQVNAGFSHFAEDFLGADHDLKVGVQYNRGSLEAMGGYPGGGIYYDYYGENYLLYVQQQYSYGGIVDKIGTFLDDSVSIGDRLTVNFGLRFDHQKATYPALPLLDGWEETDELAPGIDDLITWNVFSPRIGLAFQLTSDRKTLLKASYGRYYDSMHISNFAWPGPGYTDWYAYEWWDGAWELWDYFPGEIGYIMDPNIKNPYAEQLFAGLERELIPDFSVSAMYIHKTEGNSLGWEGRNTSYVQVQRVSPDNGQTYTVFNRTGDYPETWQTNPEGYAQKYDGLIFELKKKYSQNWMMNSSLTWSHSTGLNMRAHSTGQHNLTSYAGSFGVDPNDLINAEGDLQHDKRWVFKFTGGYNLPWDIFLGTYFTFQTGRPRPVQVRVSDLNQGRREILAEPRGEVRYPSFYTLNLRAQKTFTLHGSWKLKVMLDVFNATNDATFRSWRSNSMWRGTFEEESGLPDPISVQLGFRLQF